MIGEGCSGEMGMAGVGGSGRWWICSPSSSLFVRKAPSPTRIGLRLRTNALFGDWGLGNRKNTQQQQQQQQLSFSLTDTETMSVSVVSSISEVPGREWDACAADASGPHSFNPFISHAFLSALEHSASAVRETGWMPHHIVAKDQANNILAVVPLYLKTHSYGEFVFDHSWANAYHSYGYKYYPKLQSCVPFTPVTGPRILLRNSSFKDQIFDLIVSAMKDLTANSQLSSLHITFPSENEFLKLTQKGFLPRIGMQYHWKNRNYKNFDDFLMDMKQSKRKSIRQERKKISAQNLIMRRLRGYEIKARHWDSFYTFYRNTTDNKWGTPHLTREFFHELGTKMGDSVLLVVAEEGDELVAGALNLIGGDTLFGRLWGCQPRSYYPSLHFEACYYQAIEAAIELNLKTVEAGAQGEHKIQRGYLPVTTFSCHYLIDEEFREAIQDFVDREASQVKLVMKLLHDSGPFKEGNEKLKERVNFSDSERSTVVGGGEIENEGGSLESPGVRGLIVRGRSAKARGEHVGVDDTRIKGHHGHPFTHLFRHRLAQPFYGPLGGAVGSHQRRTGPSPPRRHVHYYAFRLLRR